MPGTCKAAANFSAEKSATQLDKAIKGWGTDEAAIICLITGHTNKQRQEMKAAYQKLAGKELEADLKKDLSGDFERAILATFVSSAVYDAQELNRAIKGLGTKEKTLVEILSTRTNSQITAIKTAYKEAYTKNLEDDIRGDTRGIFCHLLLTLCAASREETKKADPTTAAAGVADASHTKKADLPRADADARRIFEAGENRMGTDESVFTDILAHRTFQQLRATFEAYKKIAGHDIDQAIASETSGDLKEAYLELVNAARNTGQYFAERLHSCMSGLGTKDKDLIRIILTRSEVDLEEIKAAYRATYAMTLTDAIKNDTSGDYKKLLIAFLG